MRITALILNWKRPDETIQAIASVREHAPNLDIVVVDNASGDDSIDRIRAADPHVEIVANDRNAGYAGGNNAGFRAILARATPPEGVLVLNNDVVLQAGCVEALVRAVERDPGRGLYAPVSFSREEPEVVDFHHATIDLPNMAVHAHGRGERRDPSVDVESDYVPGSAFLIRTPALRALGGFDEEYFLVWEDVDITLRSARRGFGRALMVADARVLHAGSVSFGGSNTPIYQYFYVRNAYRIVQRYLRGPRRWRTRRMLDRRFRGWIEQPNEPGVAAAMRLGIEHAHAGRYGPTPPELA